MLNEPMEKVDAILNKSRTPDRHSFFQIEKFMIGKETTGQAQLWAIVRELEARKETVDVYKKELLDAEDNLELFEIQIERLNRMIREESIKHDTYADLNIQEHEINIRKLGREREALAKAAQKVNYKLKCVMEEMAFLAEGHDKITAKIGESKPLDDEQAQREMWNEKLLEEFNLRVILQRPLDPEFVKTVMCLHDEASVKKHVVSLINNIQTKMLGDNKSQQKRPLIEAKPQVTGR